MPLANSGSESIKKIILFNGPPQCGKDTAADIISGKLHKLSFKYKMAKPLKEACHALLGLQGTLEDLEHLKSTPIKFLIQKEYNYFPATSFMVNADQEMTLRQFYIHISENVMKPMFGKDVFGRIAVENLKQNHNAVSTVSDCGFAEEAFPIVEYFGTNHVCLVRVHREGTNFSEDSRTYIDLPVDLIIDIENNTDIDKFSDRLWRKLNKNFLNGVF